MVAFLQVAAITHQPQDDGWEGSVYIKRAMSAEPSDLKTVRVDLGARAYDMVIGSGILSRLGDFLPPGAFHDPVAIITDARVGPLLGERMQLSVMAAGLSSFVVEVPAGESSKSLEVLAHLHSRLARKKVPRSGTVLALGGGVIGDLAGFLAASYLRGVNFIQVPTTLLAMVDSSVGGKTGVNLPEGKNLVGAFHQPRLVVADLDTLATLPPREFAAGMAEVIKYGAIADRALFDRVARGVRPDAADLAEIIEKCVAIKARIVEQDEFEEKGLRALLNFGHTIGHAIEKATGYERYLHGEAVALGLRAAAWLSRQKDGLSQEDARDLEVALLANQLPVLLDPKVDQDDVLAALGNDKKVATDGGNRWVLLPRLGEAESGRQIEPEMVARAVGHLRIHPDDL
jgi:3-dehydroquinate synthase